MCDDRAVLDAASDRLLAAPLDSFAVEIERMIGRGDITEADSAELAGVVVASLILAYVELFPAATRAPVAAALLCDIKSIVAESTGGAHVRRR